MHAGRNYSLKQVLLWTRRDIFFLTIIACIPTLLYSQLQWKWLIVPWLPIALIGTAVAFVIGFKNNASYDRMWEARRAWGGIVNTSRSWGIMAKDYVTGYKQADQLNPGALQEVHRQLIYRHMAWLTALRYQLREPRTWENMQKSYNAEFRDHTFRIAEYEEELKDELAKFLSKEELDYVLSKKNRATHIISLQSSHLKELEQQGWIESYRHTELEKQLVELYNQQGACERIKNFPFPRQYATLNMFFVRLFICIVPFGMLQEFQKIGVGFVWLNIPFSVLVTWVFNTMEKIGESTENPFEGSANDIPITAMTRTIEIDMREMLDEKDIPAGLQPVNNILT